MHSTDSFTVAAVQMHSELGNLAGNLEKALSGIDKSAQEGASLVCLPELFNTGYLLEPHRPYQLSEPIDGYTVNRIQEAARRHRMIILAPIAERAEVAGVVYNTAVLISETGEILGYTRKNYRWGEEKLYYRQGQGYPVFKTCLGKIGILICYDAELPEPARLLALKGAELLLVPSVWSKVGERRWDIQLPARAVDNLYFVVGANVVGEKPCGKSKIINPWGEILAEANRDQEIVLTAPIDYQELIKARREVPYLTDFQPQNFYQLEGDNTYVLE